MMSGGAFNSMATGYDEEFTNTKVGQLQRERVWEYLDSTIQFRRGFRVLELNCGTGEDAIRFAKRGCNVLASDISSEMIHIAKTKAEDAGLSDLLNLRILDLNTVESAGLESGFDLVFSNFGGLNCVSAETIASLQKAIKSILKAEGRFIAVVMPDACMMESFYFISRLQIGNAFRRGKKKVEWKNHQGESLTIHYYSPSQFEKHFRDSFLTKEKRPIGLWVPPSYTDPFFNRHQRVLGGLNRLENIFSPSILAGISDHYLIDLKLKD